MKKLTQYIVVTLAILIAELVSAYILLITHKYKSEDSPYKSAMIQMVVAVVTFYPTIVLVEKYMSPGSKVFFTKAQKITGNKLLGLFVGVSIAFILLLMAFVKVLYNRSMIEDFSNWLMRFI